ncbi:MAG: indolepyruvate decarboxylase [Rheinheimera sp.]|uniref:thiamine pyrophosphate-binding protein n=1 Tax=Arsukibacterium sp. UBA3155 TaxID=1946058 RepID=UPI000C8E9317|nr:thiamine pyrophosphate-binding protein [Arsukibacterium sp. UBA3155]MAD74672.1 indolepyruvate decarboxylase [Rheinheimera sp.]|tara:strand:- start:103926 stop:105548 length:1623 start_codon:yes stop_codon:yes gene_type:complete
MLLVDVLLHEFDVFEIKQLFGIPGDFVLPLFEQLQQRSTLPLYYLSHEPSAVFAADAAARISNKPAVVILTYGAGALNAVNAVAQAYVEHVPLLVIAGFPSQAEIERGLQIHHQAKTVDSQRDIYREITASQFRLDNPARAGEDIRAALQTAKEQSRPVLLEIPRDAVQFTTSLAPVYQVADVPQAELDAAITQLTARLMQAKQPVILAGVDVRRFDAVAELEALASKLNIPFVSTLMGRASFDQQHFLYGGIFLDKTDVRPAELLKEADLIIQVGVIKTDSNFAAHAELFPPEKLICIEQNQLNLGETTYKQLGLQPLLAALLNQAIPPFKSLILPVLAATEPEQRLTTSSLVQCLDKMLAERNNTVPLISDIGDCLFASLHAKPSLMLAPAFYASMGYAVPAAFGVQAVTGLRPVVLVGDGAFLMTGLELGHCARYGFAPIVIVFNNQRWDMIEAFSPGLNCTNLSNWKYADLARTMGGNGMQVSSLADFNQALALALASDMRFSLIEVMLDSSSRTERLNNFAAGFKAATKERLTPC